MHDCNPRTLLEAVRYFSDLKVCNEYMRRIKNAEKAMDWSDGTETQEA